MSEIIREGDLQVEWNNNCGCYVRVCRTHVLRGPEKVLCSCYARVPPVWPDISAMWTFMFKIVCKSTPKCGTKIYARQPSPGKLNDLRDLAESGENNAGHAQQQLSFLPSHLVLSFHFHFPTLLLFFLFLSRPLLYPLLDNTCVSFCTDFRLKLEALTSKRG